MLVVCARLHHTIHRGKKIMAVKGNMESDQVRAEEPIQQLGLPGTDSECLRVGPRNVPENRYACIGSGPLHETRKQSQVVILHKYHRLRAVLHFIQQRIGKPPVHTLIALPVGGAKDGPRVRDVAERPEPLIGEAIVVLRLLFL